MYTNAEATHTRTIKHKYTKDEKVALGGNMVEKMDEIDNLEREKKTSMDHHKNVIGKAESELMQLRQNVTQGYEYQDVECKLVRNLMTGNNEYYHVETGDLIETTPFSPADWQLTLDDLDGNGPDEDEIRARAEAALAADPAIANAPTLFDDDDIAAHAENIVAQAASGADDITAPSEDATSAPDPSAFQTTEAATEATDSSETDTDADTDESGEGEADETGTDNDDEPAAPKKPRAPRKKK